MVVTVDGCIRYWPESSLRNRLRVRFFLGGGILACFHQVERDIDDHVLLAADHATPAKFHQDFARIDVDSYRCLFSVHLADSLDKL